MSENNQTPRFASAASPAAWFAASLSLLPLLLYAYLGHFSRLMIDDYGHFATALGISFRHNFAYWRNLWNGSYSFYVFHDLLSPLDPARLPPLFLALTITVWLIGLTWLISLLLRHLQYTRSQLPVAIALAALTVFASIKSFHTLESIYWYSAIVRHTLPVGAMLLFLAYAFDIAGRARTTIQRTTAALAGALICFVNGGFSELNVAIQLVCLPLLLGIVALGASSPGRRARVAVMAAGWVGSAVGAMVHLSAPGIANRMAISASSIPYAKVARDLPSLLAVTLHSTIESIAHQGSILGFTLLLAAGLVAALLIYRPERAVGPARSLSLPAALLLAGLALQLGFLPSLWTDLGELAFSGGVAIYLAVSIAALHIALLLIYPAIIGRRRHISSVLDERVEYLIPISALILLGVFILLSLTQLMVMHNRITLYLFANALILLAILSRILDSIAADRRTHQLRRLGIASVALMAIAMTLTLAIGHFGLGYIYLRSLAFAALTLVFPGLAIGAYIGFLIQRCRLLRGASAQYSALCILLGLIIVTGIILSDMAAQARLIPDFATFAREWDARHDHIIQMRESGARDIEIEAFSFDLSGYISASGKAFGGSHPYYYGVDSITVTG